MIRDEWFGNISHGGVALWAEQTEQVDNRDFSETPTVGTTAGCWAKGTSTYLMGTRSP
jgi:hypothetical protein